MNFLLQFATAIVDSRAGRRTRAVVHIIGHAIAIAIERAAAPIDRCTGWRVGAHVGAVYDPIAIGVIFATIWLDDPAARRARASIRPIDHAIAIRIAGCGWRRPRRRCLGRAKRQLQADHRNHVIGRAVRGKKLSQPQFGAQRNFATAAQVDQQAHADRSRFFTKIEGWIRTVDIHGAEPKQKIRRPACFTEPDPQEVQLQLADILIRPPAAGMIDAAEHQLKIDFVGQGAAKGNGKTGLVFPRLAVGYPHADGGGCQIPLPSLLLGQSHVRPNQANAQKRKNPR